MACARGEMVSRQLPKLRVRVRFPSGAFSLHRRLPVAFAGSLAFAPLQILEPQAKNDPQGRRRFAPVDLRIAIAAIVEPDRRLLKAATDVTAAVQNLFLEGVAVRTAADRGRSAPVSPRDNSDKRRYCRESKAPTGVARTS